MIFITVGTEKFPFNRLLETLDKAAVLGAMGHDIFAQTGASTYKPKHFDFKRLIDFDQMIEKIKKADIVIAHAGVGTVVLCLSLGKVPILFPRRNELGEHLDNHQLEFAQKMNDTGKTIVAFNEKELVEKIFNYQSIIKNLHSSSSALRPALCRYLKESNSFQNQT